MDNGARFLQPGDLEKIARNMRVSDMLTLLSLYPEKTPLQVLREAADVSTLLWVFQHDGQPIAAYGAAPLTLLSETASPWLLATDAAFQQGKALIRDGREYTSRMLARYPHLMNYVDSRDTRAVRWLAHLGYVVHPAAAYGPLGAPFHKFEMRA